MLGSESATPSLIIVRLLMIFLTCRFFSKSISACTQSVFLGSVCIPSGLDSHLDHTQFALGQIDNLDLLDSNSLSRTPVDGLINGAERSFAQAFPETLYVLHQPSILCRGIQCPCSTCRVRALIYVRNLSSPDPVRPSRVRCSPSSAYPGFALGPLRRPACRSWPDAGARRWRTTRDSRNGPPWAP